MSRTAFPLIGITCGATSVERQTMQGTNQAYVDAIWEVGGTPVLIVPGPPGAPARVLDHLDGLLLPGGGDIDPSRYGATRSDLVVDIDPARDALEAECILEARRRGLPILGICRGLQMINVVFGGTLYQDLPTDIEGSLRHASPPELGSSHLEHDVEVVPGSWFAEASGARTLMVNSLHHQAVREVGEGLVVTARSEDGVIEGIETEDRKTVAVQCHTEELLHLPWARRFFQGLVETAAG